MKSQVLKLKAALLLILSLNPSVSTARKPDLYIKNSSHYNITGYTVRHFCGDKPGRETTYNANFLDAQAEHHPGKVSTIGGCRDWWRISFVRTDGIKLEECYSNPNNFRSFLEGLEGTTPTLIGASVGIIVGGGITYFTGGEGIVEAVPTAIAMGKAATVISGAFIRTDRSTVGMKQHLIDKGVTALTLEIFNKSIKIKDRRGGSSSSSTSLKCERLDSNTKYGNKSNALIQGKPVPQNGKMSTIRHAWSDKCLTVFNASVANGAKLVQWKCAKQGNTLFSVRSKGGGWYEIYNQKSNKCLNVVGSSKRNGAKVVQWPCDGGANSQWKFIWGVGKMNFRLQNKHSGKCLTTDQYNMKNGNEIEQHGCKNTGVYTWRFAD